MLTLPITMQEQLFELVEENFRLNPLGRKFIAFKFVSLLSRTIALLGCFKKFIIRKLVPIVNINSTELLQSQLMCWNKIPDDVLWKEEIGMSGYAAYFVAICK